MAKPIMNWRTRHNGKGNAEVYMQVDTPHGPFDYTLAENCMWDEAFLIAAAPELLEACEAIIESWIDSNEDTKLTPTPNSMYSDPIYIMIE